MWYFYFPIPTMTVSRARTPIYIVLLTLFLSSTQCVGLSHREPLSRRSAILKTTGVVTSAAIAFTTSVDNTIAAADLTFKTSLSGLQWADAKVGTGNPLKSGDIATIDYVMSTTGARYGTKIYSTIDKDTPYRWKLGDGSTIVGIEKAILGDNDIPAMTPGSIRRLVIPQSLGYTKLAEQPKALCVQDGKPGPIPPPSQGAFEEYQRFKNIYCNPDRQYQPDVVLDVKLYGPRATTR
jgi:FKBP-type peptidyl-prolyl cis-trans isomerase